jgi:hypothetical protein
MDIKTLCHILYANDPINTPSQPTDFWWLEDMLSKSKLTDLEQAGKLDRYIHVSSHGHSPMPASSCSRRQELPSKG